MKTKHFLILTLIASIILSLSSCKKDNLDENKNIVPKRFSIDLPSSISGDDTKAISQDSLNGNHIYQHLRTFIHVGHSAANLIKEIMEVIYKHNLNQPMSFSYTSDEDGRVKNVVITDNAEYNGKKYQYRMTVTDAQYEENEDLGIGMQIFWNIEPIEGVAILKSKNINTYSAPDWNEARIRITYSEVPQGQYERTMEVELCDLPQSLSQDRFWMRNMKMKVMKTGQRLDIVGNSIHPYAWFLVEEPKGFCWAFVASVDEQQNIAVAEVGLPSDSLNSNDRNQILVQNSLKNTLQNQFRHWFMHHWGIEPDSNSLSNYLRTCNAPGFFNSNGFVRGGQAPNGNYNTLENQILNLNPYNPNEIRQLNFNFNFNNSKN